MHFGQIAAYLFIDKLKMLFGLFRNIKCHMHAVRPQSDQIWHKFEHTLAIFGAFKQIFN